MYSKRDLYERGHVAVCSHRQVRIYKDMYLMGACRKNPTKLEIYVKLQGGRVSKNHIFWGKKDGQYNYNIIMEFLAAKKQL